MNTTPRTRYGKCYDYAKAYTYIGWGMVNGHHWDRLHAIASEYDRGEYGWTRAKALLDETVADMLADYLPTTYA